MSGEFLPSIEDLQSRTSASVAANEYGILRLSARRWAVIKRRVVLGSRVVGYGRVEPRGGGCLGADLHDPQRLVDHVEYDIVEGYDKMTHEMAMRALYDLTRGGTNDRAR